MGENLISVIGKAEDGTEKKYNITVIVMPKYSGKVPEIEFGADAVQNTEEITTEAASEAETDAVADSNNVVKKKSNGVVTMIIVVILMLLSVAVGFGAGYAYKHKWKWKKHVEPEEL